MVSLRYLPPIVPFTFGIYLIVAIPVFWRYVVTVSVNDTLADSLGEQNTASQTVAARSLQGSRWRTAGRLLFKGKEFPIVNQSCWTHPVGFYLLLAWRIIWFCYFLGVVFIWGYVRSGMANAFYFTLWNVDLITLYYALVLTSSFLGLWYDRNCMSHGTVSTDWSESMHRLGYVIQIIYAFAGATAFFVTVVAFGALNPKFEFWNVNQHFVTSMSFLGELALNSMPVRNEHVIFQITWAFLWLMFCWPMVGAKALDEWPYFFLDTDAASVFAWYIGLFIIDIVFYYLWYWMAQGKERFLPQLSSSKFEQLHPIEKEHGLPEELELVPVSDNKEVDTSALS